MVAQIHFDGIGTLRGGAMDSSKGDPVLDMSLDDATPENGGSRRPGNLWTVEAREDMFRRREAGETWETICQDYPKRSRHAMQQQYSMMKKQRALAAGTWTSNRRGRKRKNLSPERWTPSTRNGLAEVPDDDLTEADDTSDVEPAGEELDSKDVVSRLPALTEDPNTNGRPSSLSRSITDPAPRPGRPPRQVPNGSRYNVGPVADPSPRPSSAAKVQGVVGEVSPTGANGPGKRRRISPDGTNDTKGVFVNPPPPSEMNPPASVRPTVVFDESEFRAILQRGIDQAQQAAKTVEAEKVALRQTFEASVSRANRRVHDAQERLRWAQYESGEKIKARDHELNEKLKAKTRDHAEEKDMMRKEFEREKKHVEEIQVKNIEALTRQNEMLRRDLERQRKQMEEESREYERDIQNLRNELQQPRSATKIQDIVDGLAMLPDNKHAKQGSKERTILADTAGNDSLPAWKSLRQSQLDTFRKLVGDIETLSSSITRLNREGETLSMKKIFADITRLDEESIRVVKSKEKAAQALKAFQSEAEALLTKLSMEDAPDKDDADHPATNGA